MVFPLVEESEHVDLKAVQEMEELQRGLLSQARVGLIHGQMGREEEVFQAFAGANWMCSSPPPWWKWG